MAITDAQDIALHQILEIPLKARVLKPQGSDNLWVQEWKTQDDNVRQINTALTSYLATLSVDQETVLKQLLDEWISLGTFRVDVTDGGTGGIQGVTDNPNEERDEIIRQVKVIVPFYKAHLEIENSTRESTQIGILR